MMELKKNPKKDLNKSSGLFFATGMALVLAMTYFAFEWKTFYSSTDYDTSMNVEDELIEENPIFTLETPPPPPPPVAPTLIEVAPNDTELPETEIAANIEDPDESIPIAEIAYVDLEPEIDVIWTTIEEVPVFPGCEDEKDKRACFQKMMNKHIGKVFRYPEIAKEMGVEGKVYTQFTIQKDGNIGNILLRGPDKILEKEAERIINKLPKMRPGKQRDRNVKVAFTIPITFKLR